jgi:DNA-binding MarR family transcriptional regulator
MGDHDLARAVRRENMVGDAVRLAGGSLERRGLVARGAEPADGRKLMIEVTSSGRRVVSDLMGIRHEWLAGVIERDLTRAEQELLAIAAELMQRMASSH